MKRRIVKTALSLSLCLLIAAATAQPAFAGNSCQPQKSCSSYSSNCNSYGNYNYAKNCKTYKWVCGSNGNWKIVWCGSPQNDNCGNGSGWNNGNGGYDCNNGSSDWNNGTGSSGGNTGSGNNNGNGGNAGNNGGTTDNGSNNGNSNSGSGSSGSSTGSVVNDYELRVLDIVNERRAENGLKGLVMDEELCRLAELKAADMRDKGYFAHYSPTYGSAFDMMRSAGYKFSAAGENIAMGQQSPESVMSAWMNSSGHKANILGNYTKIGVGYVQGTGGRTYWVQMFAR